MLGIQKIGTAMENDNHRKTKGIPPNSQSKYMGISSFYFLLSSSFLLQSFMQQI